MPGLTSSTSIFRWLTAAVATMVALSLLPGLAAADHNAGGDEPCDGAPSAADDFVDYDDARDTHQGSIDCALYRRVTSGAGTDSDGDPIYRPLRRVNREQMAQFIVNTLTSAGYGGALPGGGGDDEFDDIGDSFARRAINSLARADIVRGVTRNRYDPLGPVSRQQMATFIVQASNWAIGDDHPVEDDGDDRFRDVDDDNPHSDNIEAGADAGLFRGTSNRRFSPGTKVLRDQMATFLINALGYSFDPDAAPEPNVADVVLAETTVQAGGELSGEITGNHIRAARASGCGFDGRELEDNDSQTPGIQFTVTVPADQRSGECELVITTEFDNNALRRSFHTLTVQGDEVLLSIPDASVQQGGQLVGEITGGSIKSAAVSGCGLTDQPVEDTDNGKDGIQFSETIPAEQETGQCELIFTVTFDDDSTEQLSATITVTKATGVTQQPELIRAQIVSTTTEAEATGSNPAGTVVRYFFDEPVTGSGAPDPSDFYVYTFAGARTSGSTGNGSPTVEAESGGQTVLVRFNGINTVAGANDLTVATVNEGAVTDNDNVTNPEGDASIGAARTETVREAGRTAGPDLTAVGPFRSGPEAGTTATDFSFDEPAYVVTPGGFHLVLVDNTIVDCEGPARDSDNPAGGADAGGNGTTTITAVCTNPTSGGATQSVNDSTVARGFLDSDTVSDTEQETSMVPPDAVEGNANPLQAEAVVGATSAPDLIEVEFRPGTGSNADEATYTFDQVVRPPPDEDPVTPGEQAGSLFRAYDTAGEEHEGESAQRNPENTSQILVTFSEEALDDGVGAAVDEGAVTGATGTSDDNTPDELGVTGTTTRDVTPGRTDGPDLVRVVLETGDGSTVARYFFDEDVNATMSGDDAADPSNFYLFQSDGTRLMCAGLPGTSSFVAGGEGARDQVTCSTFRAGNAGPANADTVASTVLGTVDHQAVDDAEAGTKYNPEGAAETEGGTGTPED